MLEILYDTTNNRIRGWCADPLQFGNFTPKPNEAIVVWDIPIPPRSDWYEVNLVNEQIIPNPDYKPRPPHSTHYATVESFQVAAARPITVKRTYNGYEYIFDCFVSEGIKDLFLAGNLAVGDFVLVHFDDIGEQVVTEKIYKSW